MHEFQQIGVLKLSKSRNYTLWLTIILLLIMLAFLLFAILNEPPKSKTLNKPKVPTTVNSKAKKV